MTVRSYLTLLLAVLLGGCSLLEAPKKWIGKKGPEDATSYLEYQRTRGESEKSNYALLARNTHQTKAIEGDIRTTIETAPGETKVDTEHFTLGPNETKKLLVYPDKYRLTYEVTAVFKE